MGNSQRDESTRVLYLSSPETYVQQQLEPGMERQTVQSQGAEHGKLYNATSLIVTMQGIMWAR